MCYYAKIIYLKLLVGILFEFLKSLHLFYFMLIFYYINIMVLFSTTGTHIPKPPIEYKYRSFMLNLVKSETIIKVIVKEHIDGSDDQFGKNQRRNILW